MADVTNDTGDIHARIEQCRRLASQTTDERARVVLEELADELRGQLTVSSAANDRFRTPDPIVRSAKR